MMKLRQLYLYPCPRFSKVQFSHPRSPYQCPYSYLYMSIIACNIKSLKLIAMRCMPAARISLVSFSIYNLHQHWTLNCLSFNMAISLFLFCLPSKLYFHCYYDYVALVFIITISLYAACLTKGKKKATPAWINHPYMF